MTIYHPFRNKFLSILSLSMLLLYSCDKDGGIIDERLAITKTDCSIPTDYAIVEFCVVTENVCFAIGQKDDNFKLFKTLNGGQTWIQMSDPGFNYEWDLTIQSIVFFDDLNGVVVINSKAYRTYDGGESWSDYIKLLPPPGASYAYQYIFAGKTDDNKLLLVESQGNSWLDDRMFTSEPSGVTYTQIASFDNNSGTKSDYGHYSNGKFFYLTRDFNYWDEEVYVYDFATADMDTLDVFGHIPRDAIYANGRTVLVRESGKLNFHGGTSEEWNVDYYNFHEKDYHSIDLIDNYFVAVADGSITTNYNGRWEEVFNRDGTGHKEHFYKVHNIDNTNFYVSGANGTFFKATFK